MKKRTLFGMGLAAVAARYALGRKRLHEDLDWEDVDKPGRLVDVGGYRVHVLEQGDGPAMLLVHGFGGHAYSYRRLMPILARDYRCIAVDLKGYGYSERRIDTGLSHEDQAQMLKRLLEVLGVDRAVIVGHSMGGNVAQRIAANHPEVVEALVLMASATGGERRLRPPAWALRPFLPWFAALAAQRLYKLGFYDPSLATPEGFQAYVRPAHIRGSMDGLLKSMRDAASEPAIATERITAPVLLLYAAQDRVIPVDAAQRIRERIPHARLVVIDRAGHLLAEERPEDCARAIFDFLREVRSRALEPASAI